ncbi:unnamed protein product [Prunus brigantina]
MAAEALEKSKVNYNSNPEGPKGSKRKEMIVPYGVSTPMISTTTTKTTTTI